MLKVLCLYVPALAQRVADVDPRMGSGTEDTPWRDHEGDDGAGQARMPTSAVLSTARQIGVCSSDMAAMSHTCIGNDEVCDKFDSLKTELYYQNTLVLATPF